ncbi:MAG: glycogen synthase [Chloroflexi bacterium]|nr:glycogen synthase [Chloroflexota bacterium]
MLKVLFVAAEADPFAKAGGLGDVVGSLPRALRRIGIDARVLMPHYGTINSAAFGLTHLFQYQEARVVGVADVFVSKTVLREVPFYFLRSWPFFDQPYHYTDFDWDIQRFIFFSQAAMGAIWQLANGADHEAGEWWPDVVHVHDWHTGLLPFLIYLSRFEPGWNQTASVMSIHNMGYQGKMAGAFLDQVHIPPREHPVLTSINRQGDLLPIGIAYADKINTVSPNHAVEMHYPRFGEGLEPLIWARDHDFSGVLNGIDMEHFDPATDPALFHNFDADNFRTERIQNKRALQELLNLDVRDDVPLIGVVSRLVGQKGIDLLAAALRSICADTDVQIVSLGTGEPDLEHALWGIGHDFWWKARTHTYFDPILAQRIYAGSDIIMMPSRYEPCGMAQMIAQRYGALPLVRETGGLVDTVDNYDNGPADVGTGFTFLWEAPDAIVGTLRWAVDTYRHRPHAWQRMQERAMRIDWSWAQSAQRYAELYQAAINKKRAWMEA